jgi:hypothetical protein
VSRELAARSLPPQHRPAPQTAPERSQLVTDARALLRHTLATLAYRGGKVLRDAPPHFAGYPIAPGSRTPARILAHVGDLLDWGLWLARGEHRWQDSEPLEWDLEVGRFYAALERLDAYLASDAPLDRPAEMIFQGPVADALTHVGQLAMLRRLAGSPVRGENYAKATIVAGRVGEDQTPPHVEFG